MRSTTINDSTTVVSIGEKNFTIDSTFWYDDNDINVILLEIVEHWQRSFGTESAAASSSSHTADLALRTRVLGRANIKKPDELQQRLLIALFSHDEDGEIDFQCAFPLNLNNRHWVGIFIQRIDGNLIFELIDSISADESELTRYIPTLNKQLQTVIPDAYFTVTNTLLLQTDNSSCGPCTVENLRARLTNTPICTRPMNELRAQQIALLQESPFKARQEFGHKLYSKQLPKASSGPFTKPKSATSAAEGDSSDSSSSAIAAAPSISAPTKEEMAQLRLQHDCKRLLDIIDLCTTTRDVTAAQLNALGAFCEDIRWCEDDPKCVRNLHGKTDRSIAGGNKLNTTGAMFDFETLGRLAHVNVSQLEPWCKSHDFYEDLLYVATKSRFILANKISELPPTLQADFAGITFSDLPETTHEPQPVTLLRTAAYWHDVHCLRTIILNTKTFFDLHINLASFTRWETRYALAYLFCIIGETAKEISDALRPKDPVLADLSRLFSNIKKYRDAIKVQPQYVTDDNNHLRVMCYYYAQAATPLLAVLTDILVSLQSVSSVSELNAWYSADTLITLCDTANEELDEAASLLRLGTRYLDRRHKLPKIIQAAEDRIKELTTYMPVKPPGKPDDAKVSSSDDKAIEHMLIKQVLTGKKVIPTAAIALLLVHGDQKADLEEHSDDEQVLWQTIAKHADGKCKPAKTLPNKKVREKQLKQYSAHAEPLLAKHLGEGFTSICNYYELAKKT